MNNHINIIYTNLTTIDDAFVLMMLFRSQRKH